MCTVTWLRQPDGYVLLCNRDERNTRRPAAGPRRGVLQGVSFIAPVDRDHGGSWIGVNEFGMTLTLLNRYGDPQPGSREQFTSRGLLLIDLINCSDATQVKQRLQRTQLDRFRPFTLLALSTASEAVLANWTGAEVDVVCGNDLVPLTSTSLNEPAIAGGRREQFAQTVRDGLTVEKLEEFHRSHLPRRSAHSVCMHREDAATVSLSMVSVNREAIEFRYHDGAPCEGKGVVTVSIPRQVLATD
jgi:transport and Golgi organization protein 2